MTLIPGGQREQMLLGVAAIAVIAAGLFWYFPYQSKAVELETQHARLEQLVEENQKARSELAKGSVEQMRSELSLAKDNLVLLRTLIPESNEVPALLEQVSTAARREGLDLAAVDPQPVVEGPQFDTYRYNIGVVGGYHELAAFLSNVGGLTRIISPVNLKLVPPAGANAPTNSRGVKRAADIEARFQIQTYVARRSPLDDGAPMPIDDLGVRE
ncbi:MAG TPA: type 4a pilus biogenesis protein PilO [Gemmatimonadaceae bacterium]|nr:type 4a pilus biogenesis protein PilO [Gemmatimonadaceae bacterium]